MNKDYYQILGVEKRSSLEEIKKAYRKLAHKYHPDKKDGNEKKFKEINEAYYILGNDKRRSEYDRYGHVFSGAGGQSGVGFDGFDFSNISSDFPDLSEIFGDFFGFSGQRAYSGRRGRDISIDLEISFKESVFGETRKVLLTKGCVCESCGGKGAAPDAVFNACQHCNGSGKIHETKRSFLGTFTALRSCEKCGGSGKVPSELCRKCKGVGIVKKSEEISINIPAGIYDGEVVKLFGTGEAKTNGVAGDLYVKIHIKPDPVFLREGNHLTSSLNIPLSEALLGGERKIKTLDGEIKIKIPAGINSGEILRIRNKGIPVRDGSRGDLMIKVFVKIPKNLSRKSKKLVEELKKEGI